MPTSGEDRSTKNIIVKNRSFDQTSDMFRLACCKTGVGEILMLQRHPTRA